MQRRHFLAGIAAATAAGLLLRPSDHGAPHDTYFSALNTLLRRQGPGHPLMLVDMDRLERNCARLKDSLPAGKNLRIVAKSLPSVPLIRHVMARTGSTRVMCFHQPFLNAVAREMPQADILLGKPMPVRAAETFYQQHDARTGFNPAKQLQWLIDTPERLEQYRQLAQTLGIRMRINIELDVGLHRGGLGAPEQLDALLALVAANKEHLEFAGFMGYDAHVGKIPPLLESRDASHQKSNRVYRAFMGRAAAIDPAYSPERLTLNGAGSPTFRLHGSASPLNDVSVGSALVKPTDFDLELLQDFEPAAFIATPVLKAMDGLQLPGVSALGDAWALWDRNRRRTFFVYGGKWMARFESPRGLADNGLYGSSSNQAIVNASRSTGLAVDDWIFLRPTQSEAVMLQFGGVHAVRQSQQESPQIENRWPILAAAPTAIDTDAALAAV